MTRKPVLLVFVVALLLTACGGAPSSAPSAAPTNTAVPQILPPTATTAPAAATSLPAATTAITPTTAVAATTAVTPTVAVAATGAITPTVAVTSTAALAATPAAAAGATPAATGVVTSTTPAEGGIPTIPHTLTGRENCMLCHVTGGPAEPLPADHAGRTVATCTNCHKPAPAQGAQPTASVPVGDAKAGAQTFQTAGCTGCHSTQPDVKIVGPSLAGIALDAADSVKEPEYKGKAKDAAGWLQESIVDPNADIPEGFQPNVMPQDFGKRLTPKQISDLVAYLLTLK